MYEIRNPLLSSSVSWFQFNQISVALTLLMFTIVGMSGTGMQWELRLEAYIYYHDDDVIT